MSTTPLGPSSIETQTPTRTTEFRFVGRSLPHQDFVQKVQGSMAYADDWWMPGMLHGKVVRAQVPSARIISIDTSSAQAVPGLRAIVTAADIPYNGVGEDVSGLELGTIVQPVLAADRVRYQGEPVAVVAADTGVGAERAAELVLIEYEDLTGVFTPEEALDASAPAIHAGGNRLIEWRMHRGDVDAAMTQADVVIEETYRTTHVDHAYLEPEAGVGWIDSDGALTLRVSTQVIEHQREIAEMLRLPHAKVRVIGTYMGGGFGGKEDMTVEPYLALLVWKTKRPVKMVWSRQESILARQKRHPFTMRYRTGATQDGRVIAEDIQILGDAGAYPLLSPRVLFAAAVTATGPYDIPNARVQSTAVLTNNVPTSAMRGFGAMQVVIAYESQMDRVAEALALSATEVRERNFLRQGAQLVTEEVVDRPVAVGETMRAALDALGPQGSSTNRRGTPTDGADSPTDSSKRVGRGFGCNFQPYGRSVFFADRASCWIGVERDGAVTVRIGVTDLGGGQAASLAQIASEVLGVHPDWVSVHIADSALTPLAGGTFGTRQLYMSGNAVLKAARELRDKLAPVAAELLGAGNAADVEFAEGKVSVALDAARFLSLPELVRAAESRSVFPFHLGTFEAEMGEFDPRTGKGRTFPDYTFGTHAAEVEVDVETGLVRILKYVACHDVGRAINPLRVEGQIHGGAVQGIGYALNEEVRYEQGVCESSLFSDYLIPTSMDVPDIQAIILEIGEGKGPFGARGIGEPPIGPPAAAIASAIADAIGVRVNELPITPERIIAALRATSIEGTS
jgi:CO/xanthine dehydrogenase Mo-binding subunit